MTIPAMRCPAFRSSDRILSAPRLRAEAMIKALNTKWRRRKQNVTVSLSEDTIRKARILAAKRSTSISGLLAEQIEILVGDDEAYQRAMEQTLALLDSPMKMSGKITASRDSLQGDKTFVDSNTNRLITGST